MNEIEQLKTLTESLSLLETTLAKYSYSGDFEDTHPDLPMNWSIYKDDSTNDPDPDKWVLDFTTNAPDGKYKVYFDYMDKPVVVDGVIVRGGAFDVVPTINAVAKAVNKAGYWGEYIEALKWDPKRKTFKAIIGS